MMRISWEKSSNPILRALTYFDRGHLRIRKNIIIPRPKVPGPSSFTNRPLTPIKARLYYSGTPEQLQSSSELVLQLPGGGFVTMDPKCHDDYVTQWAKQTGIPILSIDYGKAPEFPYPWALEECFDAYKNIIETNGNVLGMNTLSLDNDETLGDQKKQKQIKVILVGDSA